MNVIEKLDRIEYLLKHLPGRHDQQKHAPHNTANGFGVAYDKVGEGDTYLDEGPSGWEAGSHDVTREDTHVLVPVDLLRSERVDVVRRAGVPSSRTFEQREALRENIKRFGLDKGISVFVEKNGSITVSDGTHRLEAVDALGWKYIPAEEVRYFGNSQRQGLIHVDPGGVRL